MKKWIYLLLIFFAPELLAGPFDPVATDKSRELLGVIFGANVGDIALGGTAKPILGDLMEKFNFIIVVVGALVVSYVAIMSTINTAQEGTAMGKKWSAVWIPMRSIAGMALMIPAPGSGYSMIQVTVMWIVLQGIGAADALWNIALEGLSSGVSASAGTLSQTQALKPHGKVLADQVLNAVVCMQTLYEAAKSTENQQADSWVAKKGQLIKMYEEQDANTPVLTGAIKDNVDSRSVSTTGTIFFGVDDDSDTLRKGICGKLKVKATVAATDLQTDSLNLSDQDLLKASQEAYDTKLLAVSSMAQVLTPLAQGIIDGTTKIDITGNKELENTGYSNLATNAYIGTISSIISNQGSFSDTSGTSGGTGNVVGDVVTGIANNDFQKITDNSQLVKDAIEKGKAAGWVSAGSFYFVLNRTLVGQLLPTATSELITADISDAARIPNCDAACLSAAIGGNGFANDLTMTNYFNSKGITSSTDIKNMGNNLASAAYYMSHDEGAVPASLDLPTPPGTDAGAAGQILGLVQNAGNSALEGLINLVNTQGDGDPLLGHAIFGRDIMLICEGTIIAVIVIALTLYSLAAVASYAPFGLGTVGVALGGLAQGLLFIMALMFPLIGAMWTFGAILALYCPFIPFMIFTVAVLGWLLTVVEAVLAAPIIALGLVVPSGDEMGKLEHALLLLANIFLRPLLLIIGFILAGSVYKAIIKLIDFGMADVLNTLTPVATTPFSIVVLLGVYVFFIMSVTNTAFSLIYAVPDKILRWMGGPHEQTDTGAIQEVKSQTQNFAHSAGEQAKGLGATAGDAGMKSAGTFASESKKSGWLPGRKKP